MTAVFLLCTIILFVLQTLSMKLQHAEHLPQKLLVNCAFSLLAAAAIGATPLPRRAFDALGKTHGGRAVLAVLEPVGLVGLLAVCTAYLVDGSFNPFLYFRF